MARYASGKKLGATQIDLAFAIVCLKWLLSGTVQK